MISPIYLANAVLACNCAPIGSLCVTFKINTACFVVNGEFININ